VFDQLVRGFNNEAVAQNLGISRRTVETHRSRILKKLHVHSAVELIRLAARHNLLTA
jgi:DNA-binding NarL/FixJ family response regulator